jgi:hypothetical protein
MKMICVAAVAAFLVATPLSDCAPVESAKQEMAGVDYGAPIAQADAERLAKQWLAGYRKDRYSAVIVWKPVFQGGVTSGLPRRSGMKTRFGYFLDGTVTVKKSDGGYIVATPYRFLFHDGKIVSIGAMDSEFRTRLEVYEL